MGITNREQACRELAYRLGQFSSRAESTKQHLLELGLEGGGDSNRELRELFTAMALRMTDVLGDVACRLQGLDRILRLYQQQEPISSTDREAGARPAVRRRARRFASKHRVHRMIGPLR